MGGIPHQNFEIPPGFSKSPKVGGSIPPRFDYGCLENVPKLIENVHFAKIFACGGLLFIDFAISQLFWYLNYIGVINFKWVKRAVS